MHNVLVDPPYPAETFSQCARDLPNMRDLLHRRANERRQTFPLWLSDNPEPATKISRRIHGRIIRQRGADLREWVIEREVTRDRGMGILPMFFQTSAGSRCHCGAQHLAALLNMNRLILDRPDKPAVDLLPMKDLTRIECLLEIEIGRGNRSELHKENVKRSTLNVQRLNGRARPPGAPIKQNARCAQAKFCHLRSTWTPV